MAIKPSGNKNLKSNEPIADELDPNNKQPNEEQTGAYPEEGYQTGNATASPRAERGSNAISDVVDMYFGTTENTFEQSPYVPESQYKPYNPDRLVQKDHTYKIYSDMINDDQVSVALQLKKDLILAAGFEFQVEQDDPMSLEIKDFLEVAICEDPEIPFDDSLEGLVTAYEYGFCIAEKIFKTRADGFLTLKCVKERHPATWLIHTDKKGNVNRYEQRTSDGSLDIDPASLIHIVNNPRFQNPYGVSDLRPAYAAYFIKQNVIKYYGIFMERSASPSPVGRYDKQAPPEARDDLYNALKTFQAKTTLVIPKDVEVEFLEAKNNGEVFQKAINIFNMFIGRALMIPDLLGFQGSETSGGSYSLGKDQIEILFKHIYKRRTSLEKIINNEIIWPLVYYNYGFVESYPKFKFKPIQDELLVDLAKLWLDAAKSKVFKPSDEEINYFRSLCKFPEGIVEREEPMLIPGQDPNNPNPMGGQPLPGQPSIPGQDPANPMGPDGKPVVGQIPKPQDGNDEDKSVQGEPPAVEGALPEHANKEQNAENKEQSNDGEVVQGEKPVAPGEKVAQQDLAEMPKEGEGNAGQVEDPKAGDNKQQVPNNGEAGDQQQEPVKASQENPPAQEQPLPPRLAEGNPDEPKSPDQKDPLEDPNKPKKNFKKLEFIGEYAKKVDFKMIENSMTSFEESVLNEISPIVKRSIKDLLLQVRRKKIIEQNKPEKISDLRMKYLNEIESVFRKNFRDSYAEAQKIAKGELEKGSSKEYAQPALPNDEFVKVLESETYNFIRDWEYTVKKATRIEIIKAIKDGLPVSDVEGVMDDIGNELTEAQMERYARTKFTEVMNRGRLEYFDGTDVVEAYQYSAVLDDRTSDICAGLDGKIFKAGDQPVPPMHFNCRSLLVPITKYESWEADKTANNGQNIDKFIEKNIGTGFAVQ